MDLRQLVFQYRSYTPIPFMVVMAVCARPTATSLAIGICAVLIGEFIRLWGVAIAGSETRTTGPVGGTYLITRGPFAFVRNPLYLGNLLLYVGAGIMSNALVPWLQLIVLAFFLAQYLMIVTLEEEYLARKFQDLYKKYCASVPRFLPTWRRFDGGSEDQPDLDWKRGFISEKRTLQAITGLTVFLIVAWYVQN